MELKNKLEIENKNKIKQIIISKIGINLINYYKDTDNYDESENEELFIIKKEFVEVIEKIYLYLKN